MLENGSSYASLKIYRVGYTVKQDGSEATLWSMASLVSSVKRQSGRSISEERHVKAKGTLRSGVIK